MKTILTGLAAATIHGPQLYGLCRRCCHDPVSDTGPDDIAAFLPRSR